MTRSHERGIYDRPQIDAALDALPFCNIGYLRDSGLFDDDEDYILPIWAGVVSMETWLMPAIPDPRNLPDVMMSAHIENIKTEQSES